MKPRINPVKAYFEVFKNAADCDPQKNCSTYFQLMKELKPIAKTYQINEKELIKAGKQAQDSHDDCVRRFITLINLNAKPVISN